MPTEKELEALTNPLKVMNEHLPEIIADSQRRRKQFFADLETFTPPLVGPALPDEQRGYQRGFDDGVAEGRARFLRELHAKLDALYDRLGDAGQARYNVEMADLLEDTCALEESADGQSEVGK
jgi:hypothetical protein